MAYGRFKISDSEVNAVPGVGNVKHNTFVQTESPHKLEGDYCLMFTDNVMTLLDEYNLSIMEMKCLVYIAGKMKHGNLFQINQKFMAEQFGTSQPAISRYIKNLEKKGAVVRDDEGNRYVNTCIFFKGVIHKMQPENIRWAEKAQKTQGSFKETIRKKKHEEVPPEVAATAAYKPESRTEAKPESATSDIWETAGILEDIVI